MPPEVTPLPIPPSADDEAPNGTFRRAVRWAYVMTLGRRGLSVVITFILASILAPSEFGLVAMALAFVLLVERLVAQGLLPAIIQRKNLEPEHLDAAFWMMQTIGGALALITMALAPWWARVNDLPMLAPVLQVLAASVPLRAMSVVPHALLQRRLDYRRLAILGTIASSVAGIIGITAALLGAGAWALVAQFVLNSALTTVLFRSASRWHPRLRFSVAHARSLLGFTSGMLVSQLGVWVASQADAIVMGLLFGPLAVGLYRIADRLITTLLEIATRSIQSVSLPHFSRYQDDPARLSEAVRTCLHWSASATLPALALLVAVAPPLLEVLGPEWAPAVGAVRILAVMAAVKALSLFTGPLLLALGRAGTVALLVWVLAISTVVGIVVTGLAFRDADPAAQVMAVAACRVVLFVALHGVLSVVLTWRICRLTSRDLLLTVGPALVAAAACLGTAALVGPGAARASVPIVDLLVTAVPAGLAGAVVLLLLDHSLRSALGAAISQRLRPAGAREGAPS